MKQDHAVPEWLSRILADKADAPKLYKSTAKDAAQCKDVRRDSDKAHERIYVVGIGNLGRLFAAALARMPNAPPITLVVHRPGLLEAWNDKPGLCLHAPSYLTDGHGSEPIRNVDVEMWTDAPDGEQGHAEVGPITNLVVATKAQDALPTVDRLRRYLAAGSTVAFAQNGMSKLWPPYGAMYGAARYAQASASPNWVACVVTHGVFSLGPFASVHASPADVVLGSVNRSADGAQPYLVQTLLDASVLNARWVPQPELWMMQVEKLVVNAVINPLTAILRCTNGYLFGYEDGASDALDANQGAALRGVIDRLLGEASTVLVGLATREMQDGGVLSCGVDTSALIERLSLEKLRAMVYRIGGVVRDNTSSMLQDVNAGKSTEVSEFNGWVVDMARYLEGLPGSRGRIDVSTHQMMVDLVQGGRHLSKKDLAGMMGL